MVIFFNKLVPDAKREKIVWLWQNFNIKMQFKTETEEKEQAGFQKSAKYLLLHTLEQLTFKLGRRREISDNENLISAFVSILNRQSVQERFVGWLCTTKF